MHEVAQQQRRRPRQQQEEEDLTGDPLQGLMEYWNHQMDKEWFQMNPISSEIHRLSKALGRKSYRCPRPSSVSFPSPLEKGRAWGKEEEGWRYRGIFSPPKGGPHRIPR